LKNTINILLPSNCNLLRRLQFPFHLPFFFGLGFVSGTVAEGGEMGNGDVGNLNLGTGGAKGLLNEAVQRAAGIAADPGSSESES
jgi:hypothetical protein